MKNIFYFTLMLCISSRRVSSSLDDAESSRLYFPTEPPEPDSQPDIESRRVPIKDLKPVEPPATCQDDTLCESSDYYPTDVLQNLKPHEVQIVVLKIKSVADEITKDSLYNITARRTMNTQNLLLCPSMEEVVFPKMAKNLNNQWLFIVNDETYVQGIKVEKCRKKGPCSSIVSARSGYTTECTQKYISRRLVAVNDKGKVVQDSFQIPSCCSCSVKQNVQTRVGTAFNPLRMYDQN